MPRRAASLAGVLCLLLAVPALAGDTDEYEWKISDEEINSGRTATALVTLDVSGTLVAAYEVAICPEEDLVLVEDSVTNGAAVDDLAFLFHTVAERDAGFYAAGALKPGTLLGEGDDIEMYTADYTGPTVEEGADPVVLSLTHCILGETEIESRVVLDDLTDLTAVDEELNVVDGSVTVNPAPPAANFLRGDCNASDGIDIGDGIGILRFVFVENETVGCEDACDANDSGDLTLGDGLLILNFLFVEGPAPADPFPDCGADGTDDDKLGCEQETPCD